MSARRLSGLGDSAATPFPWDRFATRPTLVACPIAATSTHMAELYRLAYEAASAAARPGVYERLTAYCAN